MTILKFPKPDGKQFTSLDHAGEEGPNGGLLGYNADGDYVEWITQEYETPGREVVELDEDDEETGPFPIILRRNDDAIAVAYSEARDKVWYGRHKIWLRQLRSGEETLAEGQEVILDQVCAAAARIEDEYGVENLEWSNSELGEPNGKLSAFGWIMGAEWGESLDT